MLAKFGALGGALLMTGGRASDAFKASAVSDRTPEGPLYPQTLERLPQGPRISFLRFDNSQSG